MRARCCQAHWSRSFGLAKKGRTCQKVLGYGMLASKLTEWCAYTAASLWSEEVIVVLIVDGVLKQREFANSYRMTSTDVKIQ